MDTDTFTSPQQEDNSPELLNEEEKLSSGNGRLALLVGAVVAALVAGYFLLPAQATQPSTKAAVAAEQPASVTASAVAPAAAETPAAAPAEATSAADTEAAVEEAAPAAPTKSETTRSKVVAEAPVAAAKPTLNTPEQPVDVEPVPSAVATTPEAASATTTLSGRVLDENGRPLAGATVMLKSSHKVIGTDANGNYSLEVSAGDNTLVYGYGGYEDQEIHSRGGQGQNVTLLPREDAPRRRRR